MASKDAKRASTERKTALCYIRLSNNPAGDESDSPELQRENCARKCAEHGWTPEWYSDAKGHRSGRFITNRPQWQELEKRLSHPDVAALVMNDLARAHRKEWRVGEMLERLEQLGIRLVQAAPGRDIDSSTWHGKLLLTYIAQHDQYYADDISRRQADSIRRRKEKGITIGIYPFGTMRDPETGFLIPSPYGVWLAPDGSHAIGVNSGTIPTEGAVWRGYYDAAHEVLKLYATGLYGKGKVADQMNRDGWFFRNRYGQPTPFTQADIRRIVKNWVEYGGAVIGQRAKDRRPNEVNAETVTLNSERAVFDVDLLYKVARVLANRTKEMTQPDYGAHNDAYVYPLSKIVYCAHCEALAKQEGNPQLRSALSGAGNADKRRYRHKDARKKCGCLNRSVPVEVIDDCFARLVHFLGVKPEAVPVMTDWFVQLNQRNVAQDANWKAEIQKEITLCRRRITNSKALCRMGQLSIEEFEVDLEFNQREIARLEATLGESQQVKQMMEMTVQRINEMGQTWDIVGSEEKRSFVRTLFSELVFNLDTRRIVSFKLKPWADAFLQLRVSLEEFYREQKTSSGGGTGVQEERTPMPPRRFELRFWP